MEKLRTDLFFAVVVSLAFSLLLIPIDMLRENGMFIKFIITFIFYFALNATAVLVYHFRLLDGVFVGILFFLLLIMVIFSSNINLPPMVFGVVSNILFMSLLLLLADYIGRKRRGVSYVQSKGY